VVLQIEFLEVRLAEVMAYADIPISMRPALTELNPGLLQAGLFSVATAASMNGGRPWLASVPGAAESLLPQQVTPREGEAAAGGEPAQTGTVVGAIKSTQVELVRGALLGCLKMLRQMSEALGEF